MTQPNPYAAVAEAIAADKPPDYEGNPYAQVAAEVAAARKAAAVPSNVIPLPTLVEGFTNEPESQEAELPFDIAALLVIAADLDDAEALAGDPDWNALLDTWRGHDDDVREATNKRDEARAHIMSILLLCNGEDATYSDDRLRIAFAGSSRYDWTRFRKDHPELDFEEYRSVSKPSLRINRKDRR